MRTPVKRFFAVKRDESGRHPVGSGKGSQR